MTDLFGSDPRRRYISTAHPDADEAAGPSPLIAVKGAPVPAGDLDKAGPEAVRDGIQDGCLVRYYRTNDDSVGSVSPEAPGSGSGDRGRLHARRGTLP
jgi:hypothetical protein